MPVSSSNFIDYPEPPLVQAHGSASAQASSPANAQKTSTQRNASLGNINEQPFSSEHTLKYTQTTPQPTNCVVLKNLDYKISQITLEEVVRRVSGGRKEFVNIALIGDKESGSFRGMAFVNFHTTADATLALRELSKMVINGRKVIAEYRRLRPGEREKGEQYEKYARNKVQHFSNHSRKTFTQEMTLDMDEDNYAVDKRAAFFAKRDTVRKFGEKRRQEEKLERNIVREAEFRMRILEFNECKLGDSDLREDMVFESNLTAYERRLVHKICCSLGLGHISLINEDGERVLHVTKSPKLKEEWENKTAKTKANLMKEFQRHGNKENGQYCTPVEEKRGGAQVSDSPERAELEGIKWFRPRGAVGTTSDRGNDMSSTGIRPPSYRLYVPRRQPYGPDGTIGFYSRTISLLKNEEGTHDNGLLLDGHMDEAEKNVNLIENEAEQGKLLYKNEATCIEKRNAGSKLKFLNPRVPAFSPSFSRPI